MCGISGIVSSQKNELETTIKKMCESLSHRGPDDFGYFYDDNVALGHRRLSIIDLNYGVQPIYNEDRSVVLIFNGEIYNFIELKKELQKRSHQFYTNTDSEVIVHLYEDYGMDCLHKLNGMFAFSIWDIKKRCLFLARDRIGIKPLVYSYSSNNLLFASEINSILASGLVSRQLDIEALNLYFTFGYIPAPWTIYKDIKKLQPGEYLLFEDGELQIERYWTLLINQIQLNFEEAQESLIYLLKDSIKNHMISDVPIGAFLSGGVDSSAIVALMNEFSDYPIKTCTVGYKDHRFYDETEFANEVANQFGTDHIVHFLSKDDFLDVIPTLFSKLGEPFADPSLIPTYVVSQKMRENVKVALSGDGADELFAGYNKYLGEYWYKYFSLLPSFLSNNILIPLLEKLPASRKNVIMENLRKSKRFLKGLGDNYSQRHFNWMQVFSENIRGDLLNVTTSNLGNCLIEEIFKESLENNGNHDITNSLLEIDFRFSLPNDMLTKVDLASMWNSLEVRVPFLDHRFVEFAFNLKGDYKLHGRNRKVILKKAFEKYLPKSILERPKHAFDIPIGEWFKNELRTTYSETINEADIKRYGILDYNTIRSVYDRHFNGYEDSTRQLWTIFLFQSWLNHNHVYL